MEEAIKRLARFGNPMLWRMQDNDWACRLEMFVSAPGTNLEVKFLHGKTPMEALDGCQDNLNALLAALRADTPTLKG